MSLAACSTPKENNIPDNGLKEESETETESLIDETEGEEGEQKAENTGSMDEWWKISIDSSGNDALVVVGHMADICTAK